jgi:hypothetical protein
MPKAPNHLAPMHRVVAVLRAAMIVRSMVISDKPDLIVTAEMKSVHSAQVRYAFRFRASLQ